MTPEMDKGQTIEYIREKLECKLKEPGEIRKV